MPRLKGAFPFRLATTSYILPDAILPNVRFLGPLVDEVELVLFESGREENLPGPGEVRELNALARDQGITYNVHLPTDVYLGDPDEAVRQGSLGTVLRFHERTLPLEPTVYILHLEPRGPDGVPYPDEAAWLGRVQRSLERLTAGGMDPPRVALENLGYSLERIRPVAESAGMPYCLDVGHLLRYGHDLEGELERFLPDTVMIHVHGLAGDVDHRGLDGLPAGAWELLREVLPAYRGGVSIEVFSLGALGASLRKMQELRG
jgi:sugar phosphate isomerase/epimerase